MFEHSAITCFLVTQLTSIFVGHEDGNVSILFYNNNENNTDENVLSNIGEEKNPIVKVFSQPVLGLVEIVNGENIVACWSRKELCVIDSNGLVQRDLSHYLKHISCEDDIIKVQTFGERVRVIFKNGKVVELDSSKLLVPKLVEYDLVDFLPKAQRKNVGNIHLVSGGSYSNVFSVFWTGKYMSKFDFTSDSPRLVFFFQIDTNPTFNTYSPDASLCISSFEDGLSLLDSTQENFPLMQKYQKPKYRVCNVDFCAVRYQTLVLTEQSILTINLENPEEYEFHISSLKKKFNINHDIKFQFMKSIDYKLFIITEQGMIFVFHTDENNYEPNVELNIDTAIAMRIPSHNIGFAQKLKGYSSLKQNQLTDITILTDN